MARIAIIGFHDLYLMQFLYKYTTILDEHNIEYDVLFWNRSGVEYPQKFKGNAICFDYPTSNYVSKWRKIRGYLKCRRFFIKQIKKNHYDRLILLTTQTAIALSNVALFKYKKRYIYDFRDLTMEHIRWYRVLVNQLIQRSFFTAISSRGFVPFIGGKTSKFVMAHNCNDLEVHPHLHREDLPLNLVFWGMLRQVEYHKKICDYFGNDERFRLVYHGEGAIEELKQYCIANNYSNIVFSGRYFPEEIEGFAEETDILMNLYENEGKQEFALTVKLYDSIRYSLPMLVMANSYMAQYVENRKFSYTFSFSSTDKDEIVTWYFSGERSQDDFAEMLSAVTCDDLVFKEELLGFSEDQQAKGHCKS